jgi:hypothetical protein
MSHDPFTDIMAPAPAICYLVTVQLYCTSDEPKKFYFRADDSLDVVDHLDEEVQDSRIREFLKAELPNNLAETPIGGKMIFVTPNAVSWNNMHHLV